jgi:hypothetical protein
MTTTHTAHVKYNRNPLTLSWQTNVFYDGDRLQCIKNYLITNVWTNISIVWSDIVMAKQRDVRNF